ncbi:MAG: TIGR00159 family protein [Candidatus Eremiobacteraeota bacterium]|nr:TIGR00159 family protein [Candidatus Eremiobacteraeota bacterium]MBV9646182.1 TIGR00159 family protein [Candidatus Eremiobacteraeota bacterium]
MGVTLWGFAIGLQDLVDVLATAFLIYYLLLLIRGTRGVRIMIGLLLLLIVLGVSTRVHLLVLTTVLQFLLVGTAVSLPILFQPELRRALEQLGRSGFFSFRDPADERAGGEAALSLLARTAIILSNSRIGALIAIEQSTGLREFVESGTRLDAQLSLELLLTIFTPHSPLHDGAVIVKDGTIEAAGCFLPLSDNVTAGAHLGTRHRAAVGLSEQTDAVVIVVSEQSGHVSIARTGRISREIDDEQRLRSVLLACCRAPRRRRAGRKQQPSAARTVPASELVNPSA